MMSFGALIDHIGRVCALEPADAYKVAEPVWANRAPDAHEVEPPDDESLRELARSLGLEVDTVLWLTRNAPSAQAFVAGA